MEQQLNKQKYNLQELELENSEKEAIRIAAEEQRLLVKQQLEKIQKEKEELRLHQEKIAREQEEMKIY